MKALSQIFISGIPSILAISACIILSCLQLSAQSNDGSEGTIYNAVERSGKRFYQDGVLLGQKELESLLAPTPYTYQNIEKYRRGFDAGLGLLIGSGALEFAGGVMASIAITYLAMEGLVVGIANSLFVIPLLMTPGAQNVNIEHWPAEFTGIYLPLLNVSAYFIYAGLAGLIAGTTVICVYNARLNNVKRAINDSSLQRLNLAFGVQRHGIGFALNF